MTLMMMWTAGNNHHHGHIGVGDVTTPGMITSNDPVVNGHIHNATANATVAATATAHHGHVHHRPLHNLLAALSFEPHPPHPHQHFSESSCVPSGSLHKPPPQQQRPFHETSRRGMVTAALFRLRGGNDRASGDDQHDVSPDPHLTKAVCDENEVDDDVHDDDTNDTSNDDDHDLWNDSKNNNNNCNSSMKQMRESSAATARSSSSDTNSSNSSNLAPFGTPRSSLVEDEIRRFTTSRRDCFPPTTNASGFVPNGRHHHSHRISSPVHAVSHILHRTLDPDSSVEVVFFDALQEGDGASADEFQEEEDSTTTKAAGHGESSIIPHIMSPRGGGGLGGPDDGFEMFHGTFYQQHAARHHTIETRPIHRTLSHDDAPAVDGMKEDVAHLAFIGTIASSSSSQAAPAAAESSYHAHNKGYSDENAAPYWIEPPMAPPPPHDLPLRFLRAGKGDAIEGMRRYQNTLQWRREYSIDTILREPSPHFDLIKQHYIHSCHERGKNGEPCYYEQPPKCNLKALRQGGVTMQQLLRHYAMIQEFHWQVLERDDFCRSIYIIDLDGIRLGDFVGEVIDFVKKASEFTSQHYPERAGYVFVINVPAWFKLIWNVVKPWIDETTLQKIQILRGKAEIQHALQERIELECIPIEYGGTSRYVLGQSPQEQLLRAWIHHNNDVAATATVAGAGAVAPPSCGGVVGQCRFCSWIPARSY